MALPKDASFTQFGNVALDGGDAAPASQTAATNNQSKPMLVDAYGRPWVNLLGTSPTGSMKEIPVPGATADAVDSLQHFAHVGNDPTAFVAAGPVKFYLASAFNAVAVDRWLQVFDLPGVAAPPDASVPIFQVAMRQSDADVSDEINFMNLGVLLDDNLKVAISTTPNVLTAAGASAYWFHVLYWNQ